MARTIHTRAAIAGRPHVMIATPAASGDVSSIYASSLAASWPALAEAGIAADYLQHTNNCHVDDARNGIVREFLSTDCEALIFLDADMGWQPEDLVALAKADADVVAGAYPKKHDQAEFTVWPLPGDRWAREDGLVEVEGAPTGFMKIRRTVLERLAEKSRKWTGQGDPADVRPYAGVFERTFEDGRRWSGDYAFCRKWRALGGSIFIVPEMKLSHEGKKVWTARLGDHWRSEAGLESATFVRAARRLLAGDDPIECIHLMSESWGNNPFSAPTDLLVALHMMAKGLNAPVIETGSGLSTIVMVAAGADVYSLEHDLLWYRRVKAALEGLGLSAEGLIYAPLASDTGWYSLPPTMPGEFGLVFCDGPQRVFGSRHRLWELGESIAGADWIIDDCDPQEVAGRQAERMVDGARWSIARRPEMAGSAAA